MIVTALPTTVKAPPTLPAYRVTARNQIRLIVFCKHCKDYHFHGGGGHCVAHCHVATSPYLATGYILQEVGEITAAIRRDFRRRRPRGPGPVAVRA